MTNKMESFKADTDIKEEPSDENGEAMLFVETSMDCKDNIDNTMIQLSEKSEVSITDIYNKSLSVDIKGELNEEDHQRDELNIPNLSQDRFEETVKATSFSNENYQNDKSTKYNETFNQYTRIDPQNPYCCLVCNKRFHNQKKFQKHFYTHAPKKGIKCNTCGEHFGKLWELAKHKKSHGNVENHFKCEGCHKTFHGRSLLERHKLLHDSVGMRECPGSSAIKGELNLTDSTQDKCQETVKSATFSTDNQLESTSSTRNKSFYQKMHYARDYPFCCLVCDKRFGSKLGLTKHSQVHNNFKCESCGKYFGNIIELTKHKKSHVNLKNHFKCEHCPKSFKEKWILDQHNILHKGLGIHKDDNICSVCNKTFYYKTDLKIHSRIHTA